MSNPIRNAVVSISKRDLVTCKRCGCPDLAWVKFKSGRSALVETACERPLWRGDGPAPEGLFALKFNYHRCDEYLAQKAEIERRASQCHPKADNPAEILADACGYLIREAVAVGGSAELKRLTDPSDPFTQAILTLTTAQSQVPNLK